MLKEIPMPEPNLVSCPSCGNKEFEIHEWSTLSPVPSGDSFVPTFIQNFYICMQCGYRLDTTADLELTAIDVYIVGDSISGRRQGLNRVLAQVGRLKCMSSDEWMAGTMGELAKSGYISFRHDYDTKTIQEKSWIFTKSAWKRAEGNPEFRLTEGQYAVNLKGMI